MVDKTKGRYRKLCLGVSLSCMAMSMQQAFAAEDAVEVTVTGSFISRPADRPVPVSVMTHEDIQAEQRITLTEIVRDMPQISSANVTANGLNPTNSINLRGLGTRSTLVMLNGQRMTIDANSASGVDINNLAPSIMVERMELVLDGASALYGSDAVAGVANFITRNNFEGAEVQVSSQVAEAQSSIPEVGLSAIFGVQGDRTGIVAALEWQKRSDVMEAEDIRSEERLEEGLKTAYFNPGSFRGLDGTIYPDPLCGSTEIGGTGEDRYSNPAGFVSGPFCRGLLSLQRTLIPETENLTGMAVVTHEFDLDWVNQMTLEMNFAKATMRRHEGTGLPYLSQATYGLVMPASNPGVIDANMRDPNFPLQDYDTIYSRFQSPVEGPVIMTTKQWTYRTALSFDGQLTDTMDWRVSGTYSQNDEFSQDVDVIMDRFARAVAGYGGPNCDFSSVEGAANSTTVQPGVGDCYYYNPFASRLVAQPGDATYNDPVVSEWIRWGESPMGYAKFYSLEGVVTGDLWEMGGGTTGFALGAQFRRQDLEIHNDPIQKDGGFGFAPQAVYDWDSQRDTNAVFAEVVLFPTDTLEVDIAARYEDTEGVSSTEPKVSVLWTPAENLFVRASAGSSFRLASENQVSGIGEGLGSVYPIGGEVSQARGLTVGNPDLEPEESDNWSLGFTWDVNDMLTVEATWWDYEFTNLVTSTNATEILLDDIADGYIDNLDAHPLFPGSPNEVCEITGRWSGNASDPLPAGCATGFDFSIFNNSWVNQDAVETSGLDFTLALSNDLFGGVLENRLVGTWVESYKGTNAAGDLVEVVGTNGSGVQGVGINPEYRVNLIHNYSMGNHVARATWRYTAGTENISEDPNTANTSEASFTQLDLTYTYLFPTRTESSLTLAVLNVADREPPLVANGLLTSNSGIIDPRGRMWRLSYNRSF